MPAVDANRTLRGAAAGAVAAAVWAIAQPLDQRVFKVPYDDTELLGKALTRGRAWPIVGTLMHIGNGAAFGAAYAAGRDSLPIPAALKGPAAAMAECVGTWPMVAVTDRIHPARDSLPKLWGTPGAFAQACWRHLLFGVVLGEVERRLNPPAAPEADVPEANFSSNGHGNLEHAVSVGPVR